MNSTWSEELVAEWLELNGWFVQTGVPLASKEAGGRGEADVVGLKIVDGEPHILHVEVGSLGQAPEDNLKTVRKKFAPENRKYLLDGMGLKKAHWQSRYVATWVSTPTLNLIRKADFQIDRLEEVIKDEIILDLTAWKLKEGKNRRSGQAPTPPIKLWLICFLDFIMTHRVPLVQLHEHSR